jgi:hypothetical protein
VFLGERFDEAVQAGAIFGTHVHELHAHAVAGAAVANDGAGAHFATGDIEEQLHVSAGGERLVVEKECAADTHFLRVGNVALAGTLPGYEQVLRRLKPRIAAAFVFWNFDRADLAFRVIQDARGRKGWCRMTHLR